MSGSASYVLLPAEVRRCNASGLYLMKRAMCLTCSACMLQGVQFHPESVITYKGKTVVQNFIHALDQ